MDPETPGETIDAKRQRLASVPKADDQCKGCKTRKIRCDRSIPCSNCRMAGIACEKVDSVPEKRPKPDQATRLEDHIEALESRLRAVESQLSSQRHVSERSLALAQAPDVTGSNSRVVPVTTLPITLYEGESSFTSQSHHARDAAEIIANSNESGPGGSNLHAEFHSLKSLLQPASQTNRASNNESQNAVQVSLPLPAGFVVRMLRKFQEKKPLFLCSYPVNDLSLLERLCQRVYFPTRAVSAGDVAAMHGILYFLMKEYLTSRDDFCNEADLRAHLKSCKQSFEAGIEEYDVLTVPSMENIIALTMGILKAQDEGKPLLGCHLVSTTMRHCQMLGYHRESTYKKDPDGNASNKRRLFWTNYVFDKTMSLLLGRASYIQDFDIDVQISAPSLDPTIRPWDEAFVWMIKLAQVEGKIYNDLYSATALKATHTERSKHILDLKLAIEQCQKSRYEIDYSKVEQIEIFELSVKTWDVLHYSTLTSLLRAGSTATNGGEIGPECFKAARLSLESHLQCFPGYSDSDVFTVADYANWVLLYSSFTPFVVIFLHAIAAISMEDVKLLEEVVTTLRPARGVSSASERLYNIGANFARVARGLVEAQKSCVGKYNEQRGSLQLSDDLRTGDIFFSGHEQDSLSADMMSYLTYPEAQDMSTLLDSWDNGQPSAMDLLGVHFGRPY